MENLEATVAIAGNFVDELNWEAFVEEQRILAPLDPTVTGRVLRFVEEERLTLRQHPFVRVNMSQEDTPWADFRTQRQG